MGFFEVFCAESGLVLAGETKLLLVSEGKAGAYEQISAPICGCYDRYGVIDLPEPLDPNAQAIDRFCRTLKFDRPPESDLHSVLSDIRYGGVPGRDGARVSYALIDAEIFRAIVETVAHGGKREWAAVAEGELERKDFGELLNLAFPMLEKSREIYEAFLSHPPAWLRMALIDLARFRLWRPHLDPIDCDSGGQFNGYSEESNADGAAEPFVREARQKYADFPLMLKAVEANETYWREMDD